MRLPALRRPLPPLRLRSVVWALLAGALAGLALFVLEGTLVLRSGAVGLEVDVEGPYAALKAAVRPLLPGLLVRVAAAYALAGAALGLACALLAQAWAGALRAPVALLQGGVLLGLLAWDRAVARPALFDDVPALRPLLAHLVEEGQPWHPRLVAALWVGGHLVLLAVRVRRRTLAALGGLGALALGAGFLPSRPAATARHPLVVLIGVDAFRPDRLSALGAGRRVAPHLEGFLADATLFTRAYTPIAQTEPAWHALLAARWPHRTGVRYPLTAESRWHPVPTFAARFAQGGYHTLFATDCSRFHHQGAQSGFTTRLQPPRGALNFVLEKLRFRALGLLADNALGAWWLPEFVDNRALAGIHDPEGYAQRLAARLLEEAARGPTLFAFHATAAHFPGDPVFPYYRRFVPAGEPLERRLRMHFAPLGAPGGGSGWSREGSEALYDELLAQADAQVGTLLEALRRAGRYDDALIVVLSDHGESFHADRPDLAGATPVHGARLSEEENRILLAFKLPRGARAPARVEGLVRLIDVGPTLLELAGLSPLPGADGVSLVPLLRGEALAPLWLYAETGYTHAAPEVFDPAHRPGAPRTFEAYRVRPDGVVEVGEVAHAAALAEKDRGAFDGRRWVVDRPQADGSVRRTCSGECEGADALARWLSHTQQAAP